MAGSTEPIREPGEIRTPNLLIRSEVLYPVELQVPANALRPLRAQKYTISLSCG